MLSNLSSRIYKYALALSVFVTVSISVPLISMGIYYSQDLLTSIGAGLLASMGFAIIYALLGNRQLLDLIRQTIQETSASETARVLEETADQKAKFDPDRIYLSRFRHQDQFNTDLITDIQNSSFFHFRGTSGKYASLRMAESAQTLKQVRLLLIDPGHLPSLRYRVLDKADKLSLSETQLQRGIERLRHEIIMSVVAAFDARRDIEVTVALEKSTSSYRFEILENAIYISVFHTENLRISNYPDSARFPKSSAIYSAHFVDFDRQIKMCNRKVTFDSATTERELREFICIAQGEDPNGKLSGYRESFREFADAINT